MLRIAATALVASFVMSNAAEAQYRREPSDTIRFREVATATATAAFPEGAVPITIAFDNQVAMSFGWGDAATGWFERMRLVTTTPQGRVEPATETALERPFQLRVDERGRITTQYAPPMPAPFEEVAFADFAGQFDDFLPVLPDGPLAPGVEWRDTIVVSARRMDGRDVWIQSRARNRVLRDTTIDGEQGWLVSQTQSDTVVIQGKLRGWPIQTRMSLKGTESGIFVFSKRGGRLLFRRRSGEASGVTTFTAVNGAQMAVPVRQKFQVTLTAVK